MNDVVFSPSKTAVKEYLSKINQNMRENVEFIVDWCSYKHVALMTGSYVENNTTMRRNDWFSVDMGRALSMTSSRIGVGGDASRKRLAESEQRLDNVSCASFLNVAVLPNNVLTRRIIQTGYSTTRKGRRTQIMATR